MMQVIGWAKNTREPAGKAIQFAELYDEFIFYINSL